MLSWVRKLETGSGNNGSHVHGTLGLCGIFMVLLVFVNVLEIEEMAAGQ